MEKPIKRITRKALHIKMAELISLRGTCGRLQVGAVATFENRVISTGYNGPKSGEPHCTNQTCDLTQPCRRAVHAEENLILWANKEKISLKDSVLYCTHSPCENCAKMIKEAGITKVVYLKDFRDKKGILKLISDNVKVVKIDKNGCKKKIHFNTPI